jgi:hypothetical protein
MHLHLLTVKETLHVESRSVLRHLSLDLEARSRLENVSAD